MNEEFDIKDNPGNPRINEIFVDYADKLREQGEQETKEGVEYECRGCGDCCTWYFYKFDIPLELVAELRSHMVNPHGYWMFVDNAFEVTMPLWKKYKEGKPIPAFRFRGQLPPKHIDFHKVTGRLHGYWVLNDEDLIVNYSPVACIHLNKSMKCGIYAKRPKICREYYCGKYLKPLSP